MKLLIKHYNLGYVFSTDLSGLPGLPAFSSIPKMMQF